jgi:hypothetical protein
MFWFLELFGFLECSFLVVWLFLCGSFFSLSQRSTRVFSGPGASRLDPVFPTKVFGARLIVPVYLVVSFGFCCLLLDADCHSRTSGLGGE